MAVTIHAVSLHKPQRCPWGIYLGLARGWIAGQTCFCVPRTAPNAGQSAGASRPELDGEPSTVLHRYALRRCQLCGGDGGEALGGSGGSILHRGLQNGECQPRTSPGLWTRNPVARRMC